MYREHLLVIRYNNPSCSSASFASTGSPTTVARSLRASRRMLLVVEVLFMAVHPVAKRRGLATQLVAALKQRALERGHELQSGRLHSNNASGEPILASTNASVTEAIDLEEGSHQPPATIGSPSFSTALCVSLKSYSAEAQSFWTHQVRSEEGTRSMLLTFTVFYH